MPLYNTMAYFVYKTLKTAAAPTQLKRKDEALLN
jgi:hypothetical protein